MVSPSLSKTLQHTFILEFEMENFPPLACWGEVNATTMEEGERKVRNSLGRRMNTYLPEKRCGVCLWHRRHLAQDLGPAYNRANMEDRQSVSGLAGSALQDFLPAASYKEATLNLDGRDLQGGWQRWVEHKKSCLFSFNSGVSILVTYATNSV